ncbi:hypothetical protein CCHL11_03843 [Colletotrichum chlorophyti]|uniref:Pathway-specific nitrogen regulator n=1 Tax=Colletotrichum chlorophyti TaxID=708187 RepID=A0A1Q8RQZ4_9PEZI|nr:hypothetical protein CCHL11_03843 [Colletotrichum chlorophyti]
MDDDAPTKMEEKKAEDVVEVEDKKNNTSEDAAEAVKGHNDTETEQKEETTQADDTTAPAAEEPADAVAEGQLETNVGEAVPASEAPDTTDEKPEVAATEDADSKTADAPADDSTPATAGDDDVTNQDKQADSDVRSEKELAEASPEIVAEEEAKPEQLEPEPQSEPVQEAEEEDAPKLDSEPLPEPQPTEEVDDKDVSQLDSETQPHEDVKEEETVEPELEITPSQLAEQVEETLAMTQTESDDTPTPAPTAEKTEEDNNDNLEVQESSRSASSLRRASGRTEALIQAAAKEVLERLEAQTMETLRNRPQSPRESIASTRDGTELHYGTRSGGSTRRESYATESRSSRRESEALPTPMHTEDAADSSSQHGADSDVFSDRSPRSSLGSFDDAGDHHKDTTNRSSKRSSGMSDVSMSELSHYDREEFVPTIRGTSRMPFRTPSDVRAMQYSSPAPSVMGSNSPRSAKRPGLPTISRLGSPTVSAQYSPKGRTTPTRFKPKKEPAPLVLLHVTLLPLRWQWAEILESTPSDNLSPEAKTLREAWHHLHDRVAETVCERGILLSHPQEDYEILEERLLEALDLPLRRRARVLECGHYIGPSNEMTLTEDADSDEEYDEDSRRRSALAKTHWCQTCRHDIRYESLGPGKIFRIKVYASNGLMRTGAWAACWKEMERVDVEIEPIVESAVLGELERLVIAQSQQLELVKHDPTILQSTEGRDLTEDRGMSGFDPDVSAMDHGMPALEQAPQETSHFEDHNLIEPKYIEHEAHNPLSSPSPAIEQMRSPSPEPMPRHDESDERRLRDEARLREIYGHTPPPAEPPHHAPEPEPQQEPDPYTPQSPPPPEQEPQQQQQQHYQEQQSAPQDAYSHHHDQERQRAFQNAGFGELLLEAARVFMQDKKNLAIVVMSLLVLFLAVKPAQREVREWDGRFVEQIVPEVSEVHASPPMEHIQPVVESVLSETEIVVQPTPEVKVETSIGIEAADPSPSSAEPTSSSAEAVESSATPATEASVTVEEPSPSSVEEEPEPSPSPSSFSKEVEAPSPTAVHQTITTREVVRIIETVTETVKAVVTETEVVKVQATPSVVAEVSVEEQVASDSLASVEEAESSETEEVSAVETALSFDESVSDAEANEVEEPLESETLSAQEPIETALENEAVSEESAAEQVDDADDHDEL